MSPSRTASLSLFLPVLGLLLILSGCTHRYIDAHDPVTFEATLESARQVDLFYGELLATDPEARPYSAFARRYAEIEARLNSLLLRNKVRPYNEDSTEIVERILGLWQKYQGRHQKKGTYKSGSAKLDRKRMARMFAYAVRAEGAKKP